MKKFILYGSIIIFVLIVFTGYEYLKFNDNKIHLIMCEVGQGEAILIITPSKGQILVDGGPDKSVLDCLGRNMPFWDRSLDLVILTHPHADHYIGLLDVVERYSLGGFYTEELKSSSDGFKLLEAKLANKNLSAKYLTEGAVFKDKSGAELKILWPRLAEIRKSDHNNSDPDLNGLSVVALLTYGNFSALLTGDAEKKVLDLLNFNLNKLTLLKIPHHGSSGAVSEKFLTRLHPDLALISAGEKNKFGHPSGQTLNLLDKNKVKVLRTDVNGQIEIIADNENFILKTAKD